MLRKSHLMREDSTRQRNSWGGLRPASHGPSQQWFLACVKCRIQVSLQRAEAPGNGTNDVE